MNHALGLFAILWCATACTTTESLPGSSRKPPAFDLSTTEGRIRAWGDAVCAPLTTCDGPVPHTVTCANLIIGRTWNVDDVPALFAAVDRNEITLDMQALEDCLTAIAVRPCGQFKVMSFNAFPACSAAFQPRVKSGSACHSSYSCEAGTRCTDECDGVCTSLSAGRCLRNSDCKAGEICTESRACVPNVPPGRRGDACSPLSVCAGNLFCVSDVCTAPFREGEKCSDLYSCDTTLYCSRETGTCQKKRAPGDACTSDCGGEFSSLRCNNETKRCEFLPTEGPCLRGSGCNFDSTYCDKTGASPTCQPYKPLGAECFAYNECAPPSKASLGIDCVMGDDGKSRCTQKPPLSCQ